MGFLLFKYHSTVKVPRTAFSCSGSRFHHQVALEYALYYSSQCPLNAKYLPVLEKTAEENGIPFRVIHIERRDEAQNAQDPITNYVLFHDGEYIRCQLRPERRMEILMLTAKAVYCFGIIAALRISPGM